MYFIRIHNVVTDVKGEGGGEWEASGEIGHIYNCILRISNPFFSITQIRPNSPDFYDISVDSTVILCKTVFENAHTSTLSFENHV